MKVTDTINIVSDTMYQIVNSINVVTHHVTNESHGLTGYVKGSFELFPSLVHPDWDVVSNLGWRSGIIAAVFIVIILLCLCASRLCSRSGFIRHIIKWINNRGLKISFCFVWLYGFIVYDVGMCTGDYISLVTNAPMAIIYAFKIFIFDSDVSEIHSVFHESWVYSFNFALVHCLAAIISTTFVIKYFGFNIIARAKMWLWSKIYSCKRYKLDVAFVLWGFNDASYLLAKSINDHYAAENSMRKSTKRPKVKYGIFIVRTNNDGDTPVEERSVFNRVMDMLSFKSPEIDKIRNLHCFTVGSHINMRQVNTAGSESASSDILSQLKLKTLRNVIEKGIKDKAHFLFLSDNETENIHAVSLLSNDVTILNFASGKANNDVTDTSLRVVVHCHARYNSVHHVIEDNMAHAGVQIKVVDSSHLSVELLKQDRKHLPANFVTVQRDGRVSSPFNALVVGFSEVGQDSVRFLYEFGAFVDANSPDGMALRSPFHMDVVDCEMKNLAGAFMANAPAINPYLSYKKRCNNQQPQIALHNMNCNSTEFYDMVVKKINNLNYIVIATNDDELNISLGIRIFKIAMRYRTDLKNLCILARAHSDEDGHLRKITQYYNRLYAALGKDFDTSCETQTEIKRNAIYELPLYVFGLDKEVYTYANIIDDVVEQEAARFKEEYNVASGDKNDVSTSPKNMAWYTDYQKLMQLDPEHIKYSPTYCGIMKLRRTRGQDVANYLHKTTKAIIKDKALEAAGLKEEDIEWNRYSRVPKQLKYLKDGKYVDDDATTLLHVLSQMEHLRWNAAHQILGYIREGDVNTKDEVKLTHSCLREYHEFNAEDPEHIKALSYDKVVVDLTLGVVRANAHIDNTND